MRLRDTLVAALVVFALAGVSALPASAADLPPLSHSLARLAPKAAPALKLKDLDGKLHDLADLRGKVVLINFWATWCPPCRREMPSMERLRLALANEPFVVLEVDVGENADTIETFTGQLDTTLGFPILLDITSRAMQAWKVAGLPTTFLIDKRGRIVASAVGGREFDHPEIVKTIRDLLQH